MKYPESICIKEQFEKIYQYMISKYNFDYFIIFALKAEEPLVVMVKSKAGEEKTNIELLYKLMISENFFDLTNPELRVNKKCLKSEKDRGIRTRYSIPFEAEGNKYIIVMESLKYDAFRGKEKEMLKDIFL